MSATQFHHTVLCYTGNVDPYCTGNHDDRWDYEIVALKAEVTRLRAIVAAVEALPEKWRAEAPGLDPLHRNGLRRFLERKADELSAALGGKPE